MMLLVELAAESFEEVSELLASELPDAINIVAAIRVKMLARALIIFSFLISPIFRLLICKKVIKKWPSEPSMAAEYRKRHTDRYCLCGG